MSKKKDIFRVDKKHLPYEMAAHPRRLAEYSEYEANISEKLARAEARYDIVRGQVYYKLREKYLEEDPKLASEKYLESKVNNNKTVKEAMDNVIAYRKKQRIAKGIVKALIAKTEMLKEFAYTNREEMKQGVLRRAQRAKNKNK